LFYVSLCYGKNYFKLERTLKARFDFTDTSQPVDERFANLTSEVNGRAQILDYLMKNLNGYLEQLEAEVDGNPAAENYLEQCQKELGKAITVVSEVGKIRKMDLQEDELVDLKAVLENIKERVGNISNINLTLSLSDSEECLVKGSEEQLIASLMFLISNVAEEGDVELKLVRKNLDDSSVSLSKTTLQRKDYWAIVLSGSEVDLDEFSPVLYSRNSTFKNKLYHRDGTLCFGSLLRHNGDLFSLDNEDGSISLSVLIPAADNKAVHGALDDSLEDSAWQGTETILVVDDEDMIWEILIENLQELGYTVILAEHGEDAVEIYRENPGFIDVVILDMVMPKMNGREAFHELKKIDENVKILLSSGYMAEGEAGDLLENGAKGFLRKPYKMIDLAKKMREILD